MLKKLLSMSIAGILCVSLAIPAFAAEGDIGADASAPANGVIYVDVIEHTVQPGDTLGHLSVNYYGNYDYHTYLYEFNADTFLKNGDVMYPGMVLDIPLTISFTDGTDVSLIEPAVAGEDEALYTVKAGETLGTIAQEQYDNANWAELLFERNNDRLVNVNLVYEGQIIVLPVIEVTEAAPVTVANQGAPAGWEG